MIFCKAAVKRAIQINLTTNLKCAHTLSIAHTLPPFLSLSLTHSLPSFLSLSLSLSLSTILTVFIHNTRAVQTQTYFLDLFVEVCLCLFTVNNRMTPAVMRL